MLSVISPPSWVYWFDALDKQFFEYILLNLNPSWLVQISQVIVEEKYMAVPILIFLGIYGRRHPRRCLTLLGASLVLLLFSENLAQLLKYTFQRQRPVAQLGIYIGGTSYSFPSAHALNTMAQGVLWGYWFPKKKVWAIGFSIIVGFARVFSHFHFPFDVVAGWLIGFGAGALYVWLVFEKLRLKERLIKSDPAILPAGRD